MKKILVFLVLLMQTFSDFIDYGADHTLICPQINSSLDYTTSLSLLWDIVILHDIDRIMFIAITPLLIIMEIIFIMVFIKHRQTLFKKQGTIFFAIIVIQTTSNTYYFAHAIYVSMYSYADPMPSTFPGFCMATGIISTLADNSLTLYLLYFILYTLLNMKKSIRAKQVLSKKVIHSSVAIISVGWVLFLCLDSRITLNQYGLCGMSNLRYNTIQWFFQLQTLIGNLLYLSFALYTYHYFKTHMPVNDSLLKRIYHQNQSISFFVAVYSILIGLFDVSVGVVYFNCFGSPPKPALLLFSTIFNLTRLLQTIFLLYFVMTDHTIKKKTKKFLRSFFEHNRTKSGSFSIQIKNLNFSQDDDGECEYDLTMKQKILQLKEEQHQIDLFRIAQIATMIAGICIAHLQYFNTKTFSFAIRKLHFKEKITFQIEPNILADYDIQVNRMPKAGILKGTITMIAPRIFSKLLHSDGLTFVQKSFDLLKNYHKMYDIAQGKGGKSGQFFFFSYDYKYALKTITKDQYNFIAENLQQFFQYYEKNPKTLLAKIYGLYKIKGDYIGKQYDVILMKNLFCCKKKQIIRTYDIKGSKHDRQVVKQHKQTYNQLQSLTLKDTDFLKFEGKINIKRENIKSLRVNLRKDTLFLKNMNIIDYSLLIVRVKWVGKPENQKFWNENQRIPSNVNQDQYYHIGLIDYMQAWNIGKKSQNWFKSLLGNNQISAQEPNVYQKRFMQFVEEITYFQGDKLQNDYNQIIRSDVGDQESEKSEVEAPSKKQSQRITVLELAIPYSVQKRLNEILPKEQPFQIPKQLSAIDKNSCSINNQRDDSLQIDFVRKNRLSSFNRSDCPIQSTIAQMRANSHNLISKVQKEEL